MHIAMGLSVRGAGHDTRISGPSQCFVPVIELGEAHREDRTDAACLYTPEDPLVIVGFLPVVDDGPANTSAIGSTEEGGIQV